MLRKLYILIIVAALPFSAWAQKTDSVKATPPAPPPPALTITGSLDLYYRYDFNKTNTDLTSFTSSHDQFKLGMATLKLEHKTDKLDMVADLGFGPRAQEFAYNDQGIVQAIK